MQPMSSARPTVVFILATLAGYGANAADPPESVGLHTELHCGGAVVLSDTSAAELNDKAMQLVGSSEHNSVGPDWGFPLSEVQEEYRYALESDYLRISAVPAFQLATRGGNVSAQQILIRISPHASDWRSRYPDHFSDSVFTLDEQGTVAGYALYSGVAIYRLLAVIAGIPNNACRIPPRSELQRVLERAGP